MKKNILSVFILFLALSSCESGGNKNTTEKQGKQPTTEGVKDKSNEESIEDSNIIELRFENGMEYYGIKEMDTIGAISVAEMKASLITKGTFEGKISTELVAVCKKAGCWVTIKNLEGEPIRVVFGEHAFFVPTDTKEGRKVIIEGFAKMDTTSVAMQKHFLDDAKDAGEEITPAEYDAITENIIEISFNSSGILIK